MKTKFVISSDGTKIAYNTFGKGPALILVHGMGTTKEMWIDKGWVDLLKNHFTVIIMDIRGNGESEKSYNTDFYLVDKILKDIDIVVNKCGFDEFNYFGHSYGATIGLQECKYNKNIKKVICAGTNFGNKFFKEIVPKWIDEYEKLYIKKKTNKLHELNLSKEDIDWIQRNDLLSEVFRLKALNKCEGIETSDIRTSLAIYSGTKDNPLVLENLFENENHIKENNISLRIFDNLNHADLVDKIDVVSPWILDYLLK